MQNQEFYEDELKLYSDAADILVYFTVELYNDVKSWRPMDGVRLEHVEQFVEDVKLTSFEATEYLDIGTRTVVGTDESYFLANYPQFKIPWKTFKKSLMEGGSHV